MIDRVVVGISGASGAAIGVRLVELIAELGTHEVHLVITPAGERTVRHEVGPDVSSRLDSLAARRYSIDDLGASIASGSFRTLGMVVAPCSIHTLSAIATSATGSLLIRAADVHLKERRRLVLAVRETPLHLGHLRAMTAVTEFGAIIAPLVPAFYCLPTAVNDIVDYLARRVLALVIDDERVQVREWTGLRTRNEP